MIFRLPNHEASPARIFIDAADRNPIACQGTASDRGSASTVQNQLVHAPVQQLGVWLAIKENPHSADCCSGILAFSRACCSRSSWGWARFRSLRWRRIVIIWCGAGFASELAMSTLSVVVVALVISYKGATGVDPDQINLTRSLGAGRNQIFRYLVAPASLTDIFGGLKLTVGFALVGAIVGEFMSSADGVGHAIFKAGTLSIISKVFAELVVTMSPALALSSAVSRVERMLLPWRHDLQV
jgi:hypothetical protein